MFAPTAYLVWARRFYGQVRYDLATSGIPSAPVGELVLPPLEEFDDVSGWERLPEAIARYNRVSSGEAIATLGTTHAVWLAYVSLTTGGDEILVEDPGYEPFLRVAEGVGARIARFHRDPAARFAVDPDRIARAMTPRTRVVVVTNLHNPSGVRTSDDVLREVARVAESRGAFLLVDEVYAPFDAFVDTSGRFHGSARRLAPNVLTVSSLTKCYGLAAHRVGWLLGPPEIIRRAEDAMIVTCGMLPLSHAHLALRAFARIVDLAARSVSLLAGKRERVEAWMRSQAIDWSSPAEGLFGFAYLPSAGDLTPSIEAAAQNHGVLVAPGSFFGVPNGFRLAWSAPGKVLDEGLEHLAGLLRAAV